MKAVPVLEMQEVGKTYRTPAGPLPVLRGVNLCLARGEFVMLTGPSGSGKTTLVNLAALLDRPTAGAVRLDGADVAAMPEGDRCRLRASSLGIVFQRFALLPHRSALDNVLFRFRYAGRAADAVKRARAALEEVGLGAAADREARLLSQGEMQRVALARAIAQPPLLLLADEPTGNLDAASAAGVMDCLRRLHRGGLSLLMVTHNSTLLAYADRRVECAEGTVRAA